MKADVSAGFLQPPSDEPPGVLGDIVERHVERGEASAAPPRLPPPPLRPAQASARRGLPLLDPAKHYGIEVSASERGKPKARGHAVLSAHVQPEEDFGSPYGSQRAAAVTAGPSSSSLAASELQFQTLAQQLARNDGALPVGGSAGSRTAMARQWSSEDFKVLYEGYYTVPLPGDVVRARVLSLERRRPGESEEGQRPRPTTGEDFFDALFQCLRSTVRTHHGIALDALLLHLQNTSDGGDGNGARGGRALRERCVHGPNCAPFLFCLMDVLGSAGHPFLCQQAAACLVLLLRDEGGGDDPLSVISEIGSPRADARSEGAEEEEEEEEAEEERSSKAGNNKGKEEPPRVRKTEDDPDLPFSEISEMLRADGGMRAGLEKMGFTNRVMASMNALLLAPSSSSRDEDDSGAGPRRTDALLTLWLSLLCCGGIGESAAVSVRVARDPTFLSCVVEPLLTRFILGEPASPAASPFSALDSKPMVQLLMVLYRLAHIPAALKHLFLYGGRGGTAADKVANAHHRRGEEQQRQRLHETWMLFFVALCTTKPSEVRTMDGVASVVLSFLLLREAVRQGCHGVLHDISDTLFQDGVSIGSAVVLEMWLLLLARNGELESRRSLASLFGDAARSALTRLSAEAPSKDADAAVVHHGDNDGPVEDNRRPEGVRRALHVFLLLANRHYLATYLSTRRMASLTLLGSAVETQAAMQSALARDVLRSDYLSTAFARLTLTPSTGREAAAALTAVAPQRTDGVRREEEEHPRQRQGEERQWTFALQAAFLFANVRLAAAVRRTYPAVDADAVCGYAAALAARFQAACLSMKGDAQRRLQTDELSTMVEVLGLLQSASSGARGGSGTDRPPYRHDAHVAAVFVAHGMAVTKQCLDAAPHAVACMLGVSPEEVLQGRERGEERSTEKTALALSLLTGVERTPIPKIPATASAAGHPGVSAAGAPRSWVLFPLFDDSFPFKARWAEWLRQVLGLHQGLKAVLGWDGLLSHTLLWVLAHRGALFDWHRRSGAEAEAEDEFGFEAVVRHENGAALSELLLQLAGLLLRPCPSGAAGWEWDCSGGPLSNHASRVLSVALSDYTSPHAEEGLPRLLLYVLMLVASHCEPTAALAVCQVVLLSPVVEATAPAEHSAWSSPLAQRMAAELCSWPKQRTTREELATSWSWGLESVVALLQLTGPYLARSQGVACFSVLSVEELQSLPAGQFHRWCVQSLTSKLVSLFLAHSQQQRQQQRQQQQQAEDGAKGPALSAMQRAVLRGTLEELGWVFEPLWSLVEG